MQSAFRNAGEGALIGVGIWVFLVGLWTVGGWFFVLFGKAMGCSA